MEPISLRGGPSAIGPAGYDDRNAGRVALDNVGFVARHMSCSKTGDDDSIISAALKHASQHLRVTIQQRFVKADLHIGVELRTVNFWQPRKGVDVNRRLLIHISQRPAVRRYEVWTLSA